ncbi:Ldh family oxidoreductase [Aestuariivirga sp.]|uniref:Ldh family oxidoreductase n=1 Tax=Aestuariivirga sp. TaxID=2650926 RepID=UPI0039E532BE
MKITEADAMTLAAGLLASRGAPAAHAELQARVLVRAELKGHPSHGLQRLPRLITRIERGLADPRTKGNAHWQSGAYLSVDGQNGLGPVVAEAAISAILPRTRQEGIALAAVRNANHLGMLAHYVEDIAAQGLIGIAMGTSEALVHPYGGRKAMLGTNPLAIALPTTEDQPFVVDLATSIVSMGKVHHHAATGKALEPGWAKDAEGEPTTDAVRAKAGSLAPFGGSKGYALGLALELLVGVIAGSVPAPDVRGTLDAENPCTKGDMFIVIDARQNGGAARFASYLDAIRATAPDDPSSPVRVPGDGARRNIEMARRHGFDIDPALHATLLSLSSQRTS